MIVSASFAISAATSWWGRLLKCCTIVSELVTKSETNAEYILKKLYNIKDFENRIIRVRPYIDICSVNQNQADAAFQNKWKDFEAAISRDTPFDSLNLRDKSTNRTL